MPAPLDIDQLQTFIAIVDTGSFTRAADRVCKTQSAVSMQMRRLEERLGKDLFVKDGRTNRLSEEGERLIGYARRMIKLNNETMVAFDDNKLEGAMRVGTPDDYADRYMPGIIARFAKTHPGVELYIECEPSVELAARLQRGELDVALVTHDPSLRGSEVVRTEPLYWVSSMSHAVHEEAVVPLAVGRPHCRWRSLACAALDSAEREYQILFTSWSATVVASAVLSGLAVSLLPECAVRPGMRILSQADGFPALMPAQIGLMRRQGAPAALVNALCGHIAASLDNISSPTIEEAESSPGIKRERGLQDEIPSFAAW
ncbi:LysR substrate-binding domain-containing protein [Pseudohoeflea coraliihabitans]|uniref:LysR family transcriptional regulator n=1 Tax=Pseudohoeflea coraliihabitans TaxID=2860393 RepID=A0ABS6WMX7_9HYPH|nr:LysR substrate-binding domain-containing protein [Pseudohoeflea sp. DP4N28-3]MBW3097130.1 LysR family transcriptional regulator [Pseudohoeflea sp. DP4N28-3]